MTYPAAMSEATAALACRRLAARVWELRKDGYDVEAIPERAPNGAVYSRYVLREARPTTGVQTGWLS